MLWNLSYSTPKHEQCCPSFTSCAVPADKTESRKAQFLTLRTQQLLCQCQVTDHVEGCRKVDADKQCDFLAVSHSVDAVNDTKRRRLG